MSTFPPDLFAERRYWVVGLGKNGLPAARALAATGAHVAVWDDNPATRTEAGFPEHDPARRLRSPSLSASEGEDRWVFPPR